MSTFVLGCNHRTAPVELRERLAFDKATLPQALARFAARFPGSEAVFLSTCNRVELYWSPSPEGIPRIEAVKDFVTDFHQIDIEQFADSFYTYEDVEAVRHLFRVAGSLDSMVLGESQILSQVKTAFEAARQAGLAGKTLGELFPRAFSVAKDIHTRTAIATGRLSVGSTAVDLARQIFSGFEDKTVLMVGAGKMGELALTHLLACGPRQVWITNRTGQRAQDMAQRLAGKHSARIEVIPFDDWLDRLAGADIVITSTGAHEPILTAERFAGVPKQRKYRPILLIDIAVPRDIDPAVGESDSVFLYNIDDLQSVTEATLARRRDAIDACQQIIEASVLEYARQTSRQDLPPLVRAMEKKIHDICAQERERLFHKFPDASEHERELIEETLHRIAQKILHAPLDRLHRQANADALDTEADALQHLFDLDLDVEEP